MGRDTFQGPWGLRKRAVWTGASAWRSVSQRRIDHTPRCGARGRERKREEGSAREAGREGLLLALASREGEGNQAAHAPGQHRPRGVAR